MDNLILNQICGQLLCFHVLDHLHDHRTTQLLPRRLISHVGLVEVLKGDAPLDDALINPHARLSILPILPSDHPAEALLAGEEMGDLIAALRERFEYVVLDLPPVLAVAASRAIAARADATVMLVKWRKTAGPALQAALHCMPADRINIVGVAMTQVDFRRRGLFGRNDPSFYYRQYREYYA